MKYLLLCCFEEKRWDALPQSRRDGIMDWRACLDPSATHVEVRTSHLGMAIDPLVFDVVTEALADLRARQRRKRLRVAKNPAC